MIALRTLLGGCLVAVGVALLACGGGGDSDSPEPAQSTAEEGTDTAACGPVEEVEVELGGTHLDKDFTTADYPTNPPTGGDHNPNPLQAGTFYTDPPRLGEAVHLLEHGAVIGWTNDISQDDQEAVQQEFNDIFKDGYYQLATVENPDLDVPFALSAWGAMQTCKKVDSSVIRPFVEKWYASPKTAEGGLACQGDARTLPNC